jgi:hypothetical protein
MPHTISHQTPGHERRRVVGGQSVFTASGRSLLLVAGVVWTGGDCSLFFFFFELPRVLSLS